jgi:hypothetical protein
LICLEAYTCYTTREIIRKPKMHLGPHFLCSHRTTNEVPPCLLAAEAGQLRPVYNQCRQGNAIILLYLQEEVS